MMSQKSHVCVVGAGISGLRCAEVLLENGFQVTIIEARDRIGGRICQSDELGYKVDLGPNWIHTSGQGRHPILDLAKKTHTPLHHWNDKQLIFDSSGTAIPAEKADKLSSLLWQYIAEAFEYSAANEKDVPATDSLYDFIKSRVVEALPEEDDRDLLMQMAEMWGAYVGAPVTRQSLKFAWMEECCGGDDEMFVETTWEAILAEIAKLPLAKADIRLSEQVTSVNTPDREDGSKVVITTDKGHQLSFDEVVMTTPLGWLKRNLDVFQPAPPERILAAINGMSVGNLEKVYITFPSAFWLSPSSGDEDTFPAYTNWLAPHYAPSTNPERWGIEMWNLASFSAANRHATLIFYLYGACSSHLIHQQDATTYQNTLQAFFTPYISLLPNFAPSATHCVPLAILPTAWQLDALAGHGSYCNVQIGARDARTWVLDLRHGVPERGLWFAGEHCSPFEELGTVAGAFLSGEGVAGRIVEGWEGRGKGEGGVREDEER